VRARPEDSEGGGVSSHHSPVVIRATGERAYLKGYAPEFPGGQRLIRVVLEGKLEEEYGYYHEDELIFLEREGVSLQTERNG